MDAIKFLILTVTSSLIVYICVIMVGVVTFVASVPRQPLSTAVATSRVGCAGDCLRVTFAR